MKSLRLKTQKQQIMYLIPELKIIFFGFQYGTRSNQGIFLQVISSILSNFHKNQEIFFTYWHRRSSFYWRVVFFSLIATVNFELKTYNTNLTDGTTETCKVVKEEISDSEVFYLDHNFWEFFSGEFGNRMFGSIFFPWIWFHWFHTIPFICIIHSICS